MSHNRVLYDEAIVRKLFGEMKQQLHEMAARHRAEVESLRRELEQTRALFNQLRATVLARQNAEAEVARLRAIADAHNERLDTTTLH